MAQFNPKDIIYYYRNGKPSYYSYDEELYCGTFPEEWVENCLEGTGPKECKNCAHYGSWNGVFLGYCANCAYYKYNGTRGRGLINIGKEASLIDINECPSIFNTYLKDISPDEVGDKDFMDSLSFAKWNDYTEYYNNSSNDEDEDFMNNNKLYKMIDFDEINAYYDEMMENDIDQDIYYGGYSSSNYDGGYDSF
jgi:hypothetical protein